jgi:hypothetical protein
MLRWQERALWMAAVVAALGLWGIVEAQDGRAPVGVAEAPASGTVESDAIVEVELLPANGGVVPLPQEGTVFDCVGRKRITIAPIPKRGTVISVPNTLDALDTRGFDTTTKCDARVQLGVGTTASGLVTGDRRLPQVDSFFDVFVDIELVGWGTFRNQTAVRIAGKVPGVETERSTSSELTPVPCLNGQQQVGFRLKHLQLVNCLPSARKIKRELLWIEKKLSFLAQPN